MSATLIARVEVKEIERGRALDIWAVAGPPDDSEIESEDWSWIATMRVGSRETICGMDCELDPHREWCDVEVGLWVPASMEELDAEIDVVLTLGGARSAWTGRGKLARVGTTTFELAPGSAPRRPPFDSLQILDADDPNRFSATRSAMGAFVVPDHGVLRESRLAGSDFVLRGLDGVERPVPLPRGHPSVPHGTVRVATAPPDRIAVFRSGYQHGHTVTIGTLSRPDRALVVELDDSHPSGGFDDRGARFWFIRDDRPRSGAGSALLKPTMVIIDTEHGHIVGEHPLRGTEPFHPIRIVGDHVYLPTQEGIMAWPVAGGPRGRVGPAPSNDVRFDPATHRMAWSTPIGTSGPWGPRSVVHWLELRSFDGGACAVPDRVHDVAVVPGGALAVGSRAWHVTRRGATDLCAADRPPTGAYGTGLTVVDGEVRYASIHLPPPGFVVLRDPE